MCLWASGLRRRVIQQADVGACGRTLARRGWDVKVAAAAGGDSRPALAPRMASATGWSTTVVSAVTAPAAAGAVASRSLPGRTGDRGWMSCVPWWWPGTAER
jgi:hypothetical protein